MTPRWAKEPYTARDWGAWWQTHGPNMTDEQRARIWSVLDGLFFYEVVEVDWPEA